MAKESDFNLKTVLSVKSDDYNAGLKAAGEQAKQYAKKIRTHNKGIEDSFKALKSQMAGIFAIGAVVSFGMESVKAAEEAAKANRNLLFSLKDNKTAFSELVEQANQLQATTAVDDEDIKNIQSLGAGAGYSVDRIKKLTAASIELSKKTGIDLQAAYMQLNMTLSGSAGRLAKVDPEFKKLTKSQLENGGAIDLVNKKYGGFAANAASGADKLKIAWGEFQEGAGGAMSKITDLMFGYATATLEALTPTTRLSETMETERARVNAITLALLDHKLPLESRRDLLMELNRLAPTISENQKAEALNYGALTKSLYEYNKQQVSRILLEAKKEDITAIVKEQSDLQKIIDKQSVSEAEYNQHLYTRLVMMGGINKKEAISAKAQFLADGNALQYATTMLDLLGATSLENEDNLAFSRGKIANQARYNELAKKAVDLQKNANDFAKASGIIEIPATKEEKEKKGPAGKEKAETDIQKLYKQTSEYQLKLNKETADDEISKINATVDAFVKGEKDKINALNITQAAKLKALAELDVLAHRMQDNGSGITTMKQIMPNNGGKTTDKGLSAPLEQATIAAKTFWGTMKDGTAITSEMMSGVAQGFGDMASLFGEQTAAYKAFATAQVILSTIMNANAAAASMAWLPGAAPIAMALAYAVGAAQIAKINGLKFAEGGIVPGAQYSGDKIQALVNSGEMILNSGQQSRLFSMLNNGSKQNGSVGNVRFEIEGTKLVGVLNNQGRKMSKIG